MAVGDRIRELLQCHDMTQKQLAAALSLPLTTLSGYVCNHREPDYDTLKLLADYFGVTCDFLLDYVPYKNGSSSMTALSPEETLFINTCRSLRDDQRELLHNMAEWMNRQNETHA